MSQYKTYFIDLDGTIYQGKIKYPSGKRFIDRLKKAQIPYLFVTNNSTKSAIEVAKNLTENHDIATTPDQIYTSAMATADYLKATVAPHATVYVLGEDGLQEAIVNAGFEVVNRSDVDVVVVGLDRNITYDKLTVATLAIQSGAQFIATNSDTNLPTERGMTPGAGAIIAAVKTATQIEPLVIAKPELPIMTGALQRMAVQKSDVVMVGDNYQTDILAGINSNIDTLLVYSGVSTHDQINRVLKKPTHEVETLDDWII
ncbi:MULTISPECIES: TIGR01457 family HAD-type hydrolase [Leuconostoc]|uniref:Acid sugar phosphatase n=2 Tax=Leuconostoc kimchii TaxID=136609 RepID=D5T357_LEUKI|nr:MULTISPECIES: TIGR01457 family HAD-type hydrolase [Leuconostoc]ADG40706.1 sugar phosphatase of the HAD superfamily (putative) [Leuconostoc kimchii IMSNU 11154]AEJ31317.1 sugar phosphatase of the HAD superfamily (putative) [Leuconostoc sp. C2]QBR48399.1 TIGR01457 family HAD-type hydrolase [Leuconostoc kimchii]